jgi:hypothetical protein
MNDNPIRALFAEGEKVANIGVSDFATALAAQKAPVVQVDWTPPPDLGEELNKLLDDLL